MQTNIIEKYIFEVRFTPTPSIMDKRGTITESLLDNFYDAWRIGQNRIDIVSKANKNIVCFVSFTNFGLVSESPNNSNFFIEKSQEHIKRLWNLITADKYKRFGIRSSYFISQTDSFSNLVSTLTDKFLSNAQSIIGSFGGNLIDVGVPLNFIDKKNKLKFNISTGIMEREQAIQFFSDEALLSKRGIYIDIDYFRDDFYKITGAKQKDYLDFLNNGVEKAKKIREIIAGLINKEKDNDK